MSGEQGGDLEEEGQPKQVGELINDSYSLHSVTECRESVSPAKFIHGLKDLLGLPLGGSSIYVRQNVLWL